MSNLSLQSLNQPMISAVAGGSTGGRAAAGQGAGSAIDFSQFLKPHDGATDRTPPSRQQKAHEAAQQLVATTLVKPILSQMRKDPFRVAMFHGGQAEDAFGGQMDNILADRITSASNFSIVGAVERQITRTGKSVPAAASPATSLPVPGRYIPSISGANLDAHG